MSGAEHTNTDSTPFSGLNESSSGGIDPLVESSDSKGLCSFGGVESVPSSFFDSSGERVPVYPDSVLGEGGYGGDVANWDVGTCFGEAVNPFTTVGEVFDILDTGIQGSELPGMGNSITSGNAAQQPVDGNVGAAETEQLPVCAGEGKGCNPVEDGSRGTFSDNQEIQRCSLNAVETGVELPCRNDCYEAGKDGDKASSSNNEIAGGDSLGCREVENKTSEHVVVGSWDSVYEVAKEYEESGGLVPTSCDLPPHKSETGETSRVLTGVEHECVKSEFPSSVIANSVYPDIVGVSSAPGDDVVKLCSDPHFQKDDPGKGSSENDDGKYDLVKESVHASNVVSESTYLESVIDAGRLKEAPISEEQGIHLNVHDEEMEQKGTVTTEVEQNNACKEQIYATEPADKFHDTIGEHSGGIAEGIPTVCDANASLDERCKPAPQTVGGNVHVVVFGIPVTDPTAKSHRFRGPAKAKEPSEKSLPRKRPNASATKEKRNSSQPSAGSSRVLGPKSQEHPVAPEPIGNLENTQGSSAGRRGKKKREMKGKSGDEFSKMRKHLRYLLHRIAYERNLLDAYSSEGWRGQSIEKLRPEKELQRAKADINRSKLKIRELFHRLESMSAEGKFPDSLYDSEGLIDSEDIFCAKCGSKDLPAGNDIILCDGHCDRGFHQYCLEPPLQTEEIPPGDEGWYCPACDCKFDCIDLLNDSQGLKLSIEDTWEKVFPEAVAAMSGQEQDGLMGLPSDDSEDNDYNPDGQDDGDDEVERQAVSSDESDSDESDSSDFSSVSEDLGAVCRDDQYLGLPSDDSEDNDFDPDAANSNVDDECSNASSDFTSASEDLGATVGNDGTSENDAHPSPVGVDQDLADSVPSSGRRHVERLDYKKLFDETYGNAVSDSSDDEEWTDDVATNRRKTSAKSEVSVSADRTVLGSAVGPSPRRRGRPKRGHQVEDGSPVQMQNTHAETTSSGKTRKGRPPYNKLADTVTQKLYESFNKNQYPDRSTKEKLAEELGLTPARVDKWFGNARWSLRHHPSRVEASITRVMPDTGAPQTVPLNGVETGSADNNIAVPEHGGADSSKLDMTGSGGRVSTLRKSRKRKEENDELQNLKAYTSKESEFQALDGLDKPQDNAKADPLQTPETRRSDRRKRRKSGS